MDFPLSLQDVSFILAVMAFVLLTTSELASPYFGYVNLNIEKRVLRRAAILVSFAFILTIAFQIYQTLS